VHLAVKTQNAAIDERPAFRLVIGNNLVLGDLFAIQRVRGTAIYIQHLHTYLLCFVCLSDCEQSNSECPRCINSTIGIILIDKDSVPCYEDLICGQSHTQSPQTGKFLDQKFNATWT